MRLLVTPGGPLGGEIRVAADKSISHRAVILGAIATGTSRIQNLLEGEDVRATVGAFRQMGVSIEKTGAGGYVIEGVGLHGLQPPPAALDMGNSGTAVSAGGRATVRPALAVNSGGRCVPECPAHGSDYRAPDAAWAR